MIGQAAASPVSEVEATIRQEVGKFLTNKAALLKLQRSKDLTIQNKANTLLKRQNEMEPELDKALAVIEQAKKGVWTIGQIANVGLFGRDLYFHNRDVAKLTAGQPIAAVAGGIGAMLSNPVVLVLGLSAIGWFITRKR